VFGRSAGPAIEPVAISSSGEFRDVVEKVFSWSDTVRTGSTVDYRFDVAYHDYRYETSWSLQSLMTGAVLAAATSGFNAVTEFVCFCL
jgi:hypothetical protein